MYDITSRADFYTNVEVINTVVDQYEYTEPEGLKRIYECSISGVGMLEKMTYRDYLKAKSDGPAATAGQPLYYARRHGKIFMWPAADAVSRQKHRKPNRRLKRSREYR